VNAGPETSSEAFSADAVLQQARLWLEQDPDETTRTELAALIEQASSADPDADTNAETEPDADASTDVNAALADLHARFDTRLEFGTAGLRGELAAGPNRMNRVVVAQAAAGLAAYLLEKAGESTPSVVIGYDGRTNSDVFARDTAELMAGAGVRAILLPRLLPTPVLAFAVRHLDASAGVMVTASHNPPRDNGYKVYLGGVDRGSQIVAPADSEIAAHILRVAGGSIRDLPRSDQFETADESVVEAYVAATAAVAGELPANRQGTVALNVVYTAMHGVGWETASAVFEAAGFAAPRPVVEQIEPDAAFPTVAFPNPEEPGAMDLSFATARVAEAELIIANDPDADRLAVAIPDAGSADGYRRLSGNEVGILLGWTVAQTAFDQGKTGVLAASIVSSPALKAIAEAYNQDFADTLTGFKWVSRVDGLIFGYEEALGYLVNPNDIRDKDGISAATLFLAMATRLKSAGATVADRLDQFAERFGAYASDQVSLRVTDLSQIGAIMTRLRNTPPASIGAIRVSAIEDLSDGFEALPPSDVLRIVCEDGSRVMVRPSGTEPKLKAYIDASSTDGTVPERRAAAEGRVRELADGIRALLAPPTE
jgi:phosphomannomutase